MENINQMPNIQPIDPISPVKNQNLFKYLFIASVVILLVVIIAFYFVLNNKINQLSNKQTTEITPIPTQTQITETNNEIVPTTIPTIASTDSTLAEKDSVNNLYTNNKVGFSLIIPKTVTIGSCQKDQDSYGISMDNNEKVSLNFFENKDTIYLTGNYFNRVTGGHTTSNGNYVYSGCQKENTTFDSINKFKPTNGINSIKIYAANINNDNELEQFIKSKYGSGCKLGEKTLSASDTYSVKILSDGKGLDESKCPINFAINTEYNQTKGKLVIFELGQACNFYIDIKTGTCYDNQIVNSLKFN